MARLSFSVPQELLAELKKEAKQRETTVSELVRHILYERSWRKHKKKDKQHWLEAIYAGKAKRKIKKFEDLFSD